ncbi:PHP-associated domain-containing protein [Candidatus Methanoperedens nitratireducens]|uniref:PHP C-terminal domain protein n=1 Tax=Candidatus Methanoperedens nitratireducens TaxID=1392998 RepID=A0A284VJX0_9EURY
MGGSDSHLLSTIGLAYTDIEAEPDERSILSAIKEGRTGSSGQVVPLSVVIIHILRGLLRKVRKSGKEIYSRIFH